MEKIRYYTNEGEEYIFTLFDKTAICRRFTTEKGDSVEAFDDLFSGRGSHATLPKVTLEAHSDGVLLHPVFVTKQEYCRLTSSATVQQVNVESFTPKGGLYMVFIHPNSCRKVGKWVLLNKEGQGFRLGHQVLAKNLLFTEDNGSLCGKRDAYSRKCVWEEVPAFPEEDVEVINLSIDGQKPIWAEVRSWDDLL